METVKREIVAEYNGRKFIVKFPNVGQLIDIEGLKNALTGGRYGMFAASGIKSMYFVLDMVDAISFFSVMCPQLKKEVVGEQDVDYTQMNPEAVKPIVEVYRKQVLPWYSEIMSDLYAVGNEGIGSKESRP